MKDLNRCEFIGRLGKDPEISYLTNGNVVANFSIACGEKWKDNNGQPKEKTTWVTLVAYRQLAEIVGKYVKKGDQIYIAGSLNVRKWQDQQGNDRYSTEIIAGNMQMLGGGSKGGASKPSNQPQAQRQAPPSQQNAPVDDMDFDDDLPF